MSLFSISYDSVEFSIELFNLRLQEFQLRIKLV